VNTHRARVLLVEDDASIRRYVRMALEELPLELVEAATLAQARAELAAAPVALLLTDLMLPDGHGSELLQVAAAGAAACRVVFSAGVDARMRERLDALGVHAVLEKPVSLPALLACVESALAGAPASAAADLPGAPAAAAAAAAVAVAAAAAAPATADPTDVESRRAIELHFGGDASLYAAFRAAALGQFDADVQAAGAALAAGDAAALRRVAHNLKSALRLLGHDAPAELARRLEALAADEAVPGRLAAAWQPLGDALRRLRQPSRC
jgi:DNA-binding response OmpR family regulator